MAVEQFSRGTAQTNLRVRNAFHEMLYVHTQQFPGRVVPMVLLENGKPGYAINAFINHLLMQGEQESTLHQKISALCQLYEFCKRRYGDRSLSEEELRNLVFHFGNAKLNGTIQTDGTDPTNLYWTPIRPSTVKNLIRYIGAFDRFQEMFLGARRLNPVEVHFQTAFERYCEFKRRKDYDPFIHLFPSRSQKQLLPQYKVQEHRRDLSKRRQQKAFPVGHIVELIDATDEPRDKMLLLLMAFGSLRRSEPLHLLHEDVLGRFKDTGAAWVRLADPVHGEVSWLDDNDQEHSGPRQRYFASIYKNDHFPPVHPLRNLMPRCRYGRKGHGMQVGFKGMTFSGEGNNNFVHWLHEEAGCLFWKSYQEYMDRYFHGKPKHWPYHPFLFIRLDPEGFGLPLTIPGVDKVFERATRRIGVTGYSTHSLRHFYGYYTASVLRRPIEEAQVCMHHATVLSTQVYYKTDPLVVRSELLSVTAPELPQNDTFMHRLDLPKSWNFDAVIR